MRFRTCVYGRYYTYMYVLVDMEAYFTVSYAPYWTPYSVSYTDKLNCIKYSVEAIAIYLNRSVKTISIERARFLRPTRMIRDTGTEYRF